MMTSAGVQFDVTITQGFGYYYTYDKALEAIQTYQEETGMRYSLAWCRKKDLDCNNIKDDSKPYKIFWSDGDNTKVKKCQMSFDGIPYLIDGSRIYDCQFGVDRNLNQKRKYKEAMMKSENILRKRQNRSQESKKQNCPALIYLRKIIKFPEFIIPANTEFHRKKGSAKLQKALKDGNACGEMRVYIHFPARSDHTNHSLILGGRSTVDPRIKNKIEELVKQGIVNISGIREKLTQFVHTEIFEWEKWPDKSNLRFYPKKLYIKNQVNNIIIQQRISQIDLENVEAKIKSWQQSHTKDKLFFRSHLDNPNDSKSRTSVTSPNLMFLIQTRWQKQLLEWHRHEQCVLNAAFRSVGTSFPLYFLLVKTKVDYQVVASFIVMNDTTEAITEALTICRSWNSNWNPSVIMCGLTEAEMTAVEQVFTHSRILVCDYQREQAWDNWLTDKKNNMTTTREQVLYHLKSLANAASPQEFQEAEEDFFKSNTWIKLRRLQLWFKKIWQPHYKRWVWHHRPGESNTYDGVETLNDTLRFYLSQLPLPQPQLSHILIIILEYFLPALYAKHIENTGDLPLGMDIDHTSECSLPSRDHPRPSSEDISHKCRELVDHIRSYTYLMKDPTALQGLYDSLLVAYENILQHNKNQRKILVEEVESASVEGQSERWSRTESLAQISPDLVASDECRTIGKVLIGPDNKDALKGDIVGSYIVHDNVLELVKPEALSTQEKEIEDEEPQFPFSPKVYMKYHKSPPNKVKIMGAISLQLEDKNSMTTKEGENRIVEEKTIMEAETNVVEKKTNALERLKLIPPEVFKLLMPVDEKLKQSQFNAEVLEAEDRIPSKTFRILIPVKNNKRMLDLPSQNQLSEDKFGEDTVNFTTFAAKSPERKRQKVSERNDLQNFKTVTRAMQYTRIHHKDLTHVKRERKTFRNIISGNENN
ncbi:hypothetical protein Pcinc_040010 [Petrolisthes cinctipes]|uniref:Uncharacterized protein n=1 Tax=Petrolisthes cinctipes TaxID=88211 RepID=A0AAE1BMQ9_PETCI|nr:hypothetical protein Pcinc_040010 [Petrolisthes cinctipes]